VKLLQHLLAGFLSLQSELPRFYLKSEHLLLQPDQIFLDADGEGLTFCYEPLWQQDSRQSLRELLEQLLPQVDHQNKEAVRLIYGLYEVCQRENANVWGYVLKNGSDGEHVPTPAQLEEQKGYREDVREADAACEPDDTDFMNKTLKSEKTRKLDHISFPKKIGHLPVMSALTWVQSLGVGKKKKEDHPKPLYLFEPEDEPVESEHPTVCLTAIEHPEGRLVYQGSGAEDSFIIEGESFLVGGRNGQADGKLQSSGVSRNHARITREEHDYYIEDLNSKNGTYLNGDLLPYRQRYHMKPGDHLRFAREEYVFY
jgi:hypothetical protein